MADEWCTLESDCGVFRALLQQNQVSGVDVVDVYDISGFAQESHQRGRLVLGYVLLLDKSKYQQTMSGGPVAAEPNRSIWFARQAVQNSCATHALLSIVMNLDLIKATLLDAAKRALAPAAVAEVEAELADVSLGPQLTEFRSFTEAFDPATKGVAVGNSDSLRKAHNSFANELHLLLSSDKDRKRKHVDDPRTRVYHFVTYICVQNLTDGACEAYEIDGLYNSEPRCVVRAATYEQAHEQLLQFLEQKLRAMGDDLYFSLMALVNDELPVLQRKLAAATDETEKVALQEAMGEIVQTRKKQDRENERRRYNYMPFLLQLLKSLAANGTISALVESIDPRFEEEELEGGDDDQTEESDGDDYVRERPGEFDDYRSPF